MPAKLPSRLTKSRHGTVYFFRFAIPRDLRARIGRVEARLSLRTEVREEAILAAHRLAAELPALFSHLRNMPADQDASENRNYFKQWMDLARANSALRRTVEHLEDSIEGYQREAIALRSQMAEMVPRDRAKSVAKQAHTLGQLKGHKAVEDALVFPWQPERTKLFSELVAAYMRHYEHRPEQGARRPLGAKSREQYEKDIGAFITVMGDVRIGEIDTEMAGQFFSVLRKLPPNISRAAKYKNKSIPQILAMRETPQSEYNASKKMERISGMYRFALKSRRRWGIDENPFEGYSQDGRTKSPRRPFSTDEWLKLLGHPNFEARQFPRSYMYWLIPLAAFTGARLGELCQLDLKDFVLVDGVQCIDINDIEATEDHIDSGGRKKRVKTHKSKRLVPIHQGLIKLGLPQYVEQMRRAKEVHFFPELSRQRRDGPAHAASNWFQRFRATVGFTEKQVTVFHSFRHGFITTLLDSGVAPHLIAPIVGHEGELITDRVYWNVRDAAARAPTVSAFTLPPEVTDRIPSWHEVRFPTPASRVTHVAHDMQSDSLGNDK